MPITLEHFRSLRTGIPWPDQEMAKALDELEAAFTAAGQEEFARNHAFRNGTLQGAYLIIAARVLDVREITDLLEARVYDCTPAAAELGVVAGMTGREALERMF